MKMHWPVLAVLYGLAKCSLALDPIEAIGNKFFNKNGSQFFIKGIAYQLRPHDPLIDSDQCSRDAKLMKELGTNTIRVYHVDASANHDGCMKIFADAGIYVLLDLDTFDTYIVPESLYWNSTQYDRYTAVMDTFHDYGNVLGFYIGNENIAKKDHSVAAPFLKAAVRDMKTYRDKKGYRKIPIGYSAADIRELRPQLQYYLTCGGNSSEIVDFFSVNSYSWCDPSDYKTATYDVLQSYAKDFPVPIFFSETGCITSGLRTWEDQDAVFSKPMVHDWSGSIVYEWIQEQNHYGIVTYGPPAGEGASGENIEDGFTRKGTPTPKSPDFENLKSRWAKLQVTGVSKSDYDPKAVSTRACPTSTANGWWEINGNVRLPTLGATMGPLDGGPKNFEPMPTVSMGTAEANPTETSKTDGHSDGDNAGGEARTKDNNENKASQQVAYLFSTTFVAGFLIIVTVLL